MKFIAVICTILLATSTGFATPLAAPAASISVAALERRQSNPICTAINSAQASANQAISTAGQSSVNSFTSAIQTLVSLTGTPNPGVNDSITTTINAIKAWANSGTTSATAAITSGFAQTKATLVSTSFLDYIGE